MAAAVSRREAYSGDRRKSVRHGSGSYEYENKFFKYDGEWKNGKKHGQGKLVFQDGSYYEGQFNMGEIEGFGFRYYKDNGCKYQGQFVKGELQGKGRMIWPDGSIYEGLWEKNRRHGFGVFKSIKENMIYKGSYYNNKRQGQGTMIYPKGDRYDGDWNQDERHGDGDMKYVDGTVYEGQFENDAFSGKGIMRHCSGLVFNGLWKNGDPLNTPTKLVIIYEGPEPMEVTQGQPFNMRIECQNENGEVIQEDSYRELRLSAGFKHIKAKKGTALFDMIEEYEDKPVETPYYEVINYPLTDFLLEEDEPEEEAVPGGEDDFDPQRDQERGRVSPEQDDFKDGPDGREAESKTEDKLPDMTDDTERDVTDEADGDMPRDVTGPSSMRRASTLTDTTLETPMSVITNSTVTPDGQTPFVTESQTAPLPPPISNKRSEHGSCEWRNIVLASAPPRYPPFVALDEEEKKLRARQNRQDMLGLEGKKRSVAGYIEAKRLARVKHDERFARIGEYVLMVHDVTNPPFCGQTLKPAFLLMKLKKQKREKKVKEHKPKWDTQKHITGSMIRT